MRTYRFQGIPDSIAAAARESMKSPQYGHPAHAEVATGYGPCRLCLETFRVGTEERLLFTYQPFSDPSALPAPGPVFIHREPCERYDGSTLPQALRPLPLALEGYGADGRLMAQRRIGTVTFEAVLQEVFEPADVQYVANMNLASTARGLRLLQVDPTFTLERAERGEPQLMAFDGEAWGVPELDPAYPISASLSAGVMTLPRLRYVCRSDVWAFDGTERV